MAFIFAVFHQLTRNANNFLHYLLYRICVTLLLLTDLGLLSRSR